MKQILTVWSLAALFTVALVAGCGHHRHGCSGGSCSAYPPTSHGPVATHHAPSGGDPLHGTPPIAPPSHGSGGRGY